MTVNLSALGGAGVQFFDSNGNPLSGGKLYSYDAGTTTPKATYTTSAGNVAHTNPIVLDSAGRIPSGGEIWITNGDSYKFVLNTSADVLIATWDNILGINDFSGLFAELANTSDVAEGDALVGFKQSNAAGVLPNAVGKSVHDKLQELLTPQDFGAIGNGVNDDSGAFAYLEAVATGQIINLSGKTYVVGAYPTGNTYVNGSFIVGAVTFDAAQDNATISSLTDTGGINPAYTGGANNTPTISGRTNTNLRAIIASQNCRSQFARSINVASIYSWAYGNVSANIAARQSVAGCPQAFNAATEECEVYGFSGANIAAQFSATEATKNFNAATRLSSASSARYTTNIASNTSQAGGGYGARLTPVFSGGSVVSVTIVNGGADYTGAEDMFITARQTQPTVDATFSFTVDGNGAIDSITVITGGAGYVATEFNDVRVQYPSDSTGECAGNYSTFLSKAYGKSSANIATNGVRNFGESSIIAASVGLSSTNSAFTRQAVIGSTSASTNQTGAIVISGNIAESNHVGAVVVGRRVASFADRTMVLGDAVRGVAATSNRKVQIGIASGDMSIAGTLTQSAIFTDYAEYFENLNTGKIELGTLVSLEGRKVKPTQPGDNILGVVSATASIAAGDSPFHWSKRYLTGEFGEMLMQDVKCVSWNVSVKNKNNETADTNAFDGSVAEAQRLGLEIPTSAKFYTERHPVENPDYKSELENVPRSERPNEWTCVGLLGQVHVRVASDVQVGDFVAAGNGGVGVKSDTATNMRCMEIRKPFDAAKGYAVAFCLLK